jgi:ribosome recycling factor
MKISIKAVNSNIDIADYIDAKVEAQSGKNILLISSKIDALKNDLRKDMKENNDEFKKAIDDLRKDMKENNDEFKKANKETKDELKELSTKVDNFGTILKVISVTGGIFTALFGIIISTNLPTFIKAVFFTK